MILASPLHLVMLSNSERVCTPGSLLSAARVCWGYISNTKEAAGDGNNNRNSNAADSNVRPTVSGRCLAAERTALSRCHRRHRLSTGFQPRSPVHSRSCIDAIISITVVIRRSSRSTKNVSFYHAMLCIARY